MATRKKKYLQGPGYKEKTFRTVGKLVEYLQTLPKSLPIKQGFNDGTVPIVFNEHVSWSSRFLEFKDSDE